MILLPGDKFSVCRNNVKVEVYFGFDRKEAVCPHCGQQVHYNTFMENCLLLWITGMQVLSTKLMPVHFPKRELDIKKWLVAKWF